MTQPPQDDRNRQADGHDRQPSRPQVFIPLTLDRRTFVRGGGATIAAATVGGLGRPGAVVGQEDPEDPITHLPDGHYADVMDRPQETPSLERLQTLSPHEAETVDAITSRIMPGSADDPGAHEAGVVVYIDTLLAYNDGFAEFTYRQGPWAVTTASLAAATAVSASAGASPGASPAASLVVPDASPAASPVGTPSQQTAGEGGTEFETILIDEDDIERYGYQSRLTPRDVYRIGIAALDRYASNIHGSLFKDLGEKQQDDIVGAMAEGSIEAFDPQLTAQSFFQNLRRHTAEGMFSDPTYGGNRNMVGWKLVGFPGAQRAYMPVEFQTEGTDRQPQSMDDLHPFNAGQSREDHDNVILPVSGSEEEQEQDHDSHS